MVHGRKEQIESKFLAKGIAVEENSITLLSRVTKTFYKKNNVRLSNAHVTGLPDLFTGTKIELADEIIDIKSSWNLDTFLAAKLFNWADDYKYQMQTYMALTGAKSATLAFCLVNGTAAEIQNEKRKASYASAAIDFETDPIYIKRCKQIELNHIFCIEEFCKENIGYDFHNDIYVDFTTGKVTGWTWDIPIEKRLHLAKIERDETAIKAIYDRVENCRTWMNDNLF